MIIIITMAKFLIVATFQRFTSKQKAFETLLKTRVHDY